MPGNQPPEIDDRADSAKAYGWASRAASIALSMVVPPIAGLLASRWLGGPKWQVVWISLGGAFGFWLGLRQLLKLAATTQNRPPRSGTRSLATRSAPFSARPAATDPSLTDHPASAAEASASQPLDSPPSPSLDEASRSNESAASPPPRSTPSDDGTS